MLTSWITQAAKEAKPTGPIRPRKAIAPDARNFQSPRANTFIDNPKPKHIPEGKVRSQEAKIPNIKSKPLQSKKLVQNAKILNKETNHQAQQTAPKKDIKRLMQKSTTSINKLVMQKKKILTALKSEASIQLASVEETPSAPTAKKITKVSKMQIQKTIPQEQTIAEKNNLETDISTLKKKAQENDTCIPMDKSKNNITSAQVIKSEGNTPQTKSSPDPAENTKPTTQEKKVQETEENDKVLTANPVEKQETTPPKTEVSSTEKYELDPLLARAVEDVLQDVMIQVWQELPDDPLEEEDRVAVDKLRNEAGDDLRRVLGLNITKRLLNVFNNLFVKMKFTCRPQMGCLTSFLNEYHISKFKRIDKNSNTFAAQMETIEDFDNLCAVKELMCGEAKVSVTPCYKFTECPENLKTIYDDLYFYEDAPQERNESLKNNTQKAKVIASDENVGKPAAKAENIDAKSTNKPDRTEIQKTESSVPNDPEDAKKQSTTVDEEKTTTSSKVIITNNTKLKEKDKGNVTQEKEISKDIGKDNAVIDYTIKDKSESDDDDDLESGVPENQMEGEDELDDEDILALMSEGVVLDECSGSEDEN